MLNATRIIQSPESLALAREPLLEPILKTENLWKVYRQGKVDVPALRGVSIEFFPASLFRSWAPRAAENPRCCT